MTTSRRPEFVEVFNVSSPAVIAFLFVVMHFDGHDDGWLRVLRSETAWLGMLAFIVAWPLVMGPVAIVLRRRRRRSGEVVDPVTRRLSISRTRRFFLQSIFSNVLLVELVISAVIVVGAPWWAVLVTSILLVWSVIGWWVSTARLRSISARL